MRIDSSSIGMESARSYSSAILKSAFSFRGRTGSLTADEGNGFLGGFLGMGDEAQDMKESSNAQTTLEDITLHFQNLANTTRVTASSEEQSAKETIRQQCVKSLMYLLFGEHQKVTLDELWEDEYYKSGFKTNLGNLVPQTFNMKHFVYHSETETTTFSTAGVVKTADGREINFNLDLEMSRSFTKYYEENYTYTIVDYTDPLVINLDTNIAELSDQKFFFDLDCDGEKEEISSLKSGSGYLALDLNEDGVINDGGELFGARSGNGFADLAQYDADGNGWIDENDSIWKKLLIWTKDENGNDKKYHLSEAGVGAICLNSTQTEFALNSMKDNHNNGVIRRTGIFLYENGNVGTVQHLDLAQ
ncbi:MAG: hypothetical protein IJO97_03825 [Lachnospiraceae bacterium]|nr:hypothetical protein [Lachnospiraceae bacterium]